DGNVPAHQSDGFRGPPRVHSLHDAVVDHHFRHAFRVARSVSDRSRAAGRGAEEGVAAKGQRINDGFQITLKRRKRKVRDVPIGETKTATIVANELEPACEELPKLCPDRIVPVVLEMSSPGGGAYEWHTAPYARYGKADAVRSAAKCDALITGNLRDPLSRRRTRRRSFDSLLHVGDESLGKMGCPCLPLPAGRRDR